GPVNWRGSAWLFHSALCLREWPGGGTSGGGGWQPRPEKARGLPQGAQLRYHRRQDRVCAKRRMEEPARAVGAVSECQRQRAWSVQESRHAGDHLSEGTCLWRVAVSLFGRALTGASLPSKAQA